MAAILLVFMGQFALSTYLRPFLLQVTGVGVPRLSALLLILGVADIAGLLLVGPVLRASAPLTLVGILLIMAGAVWGLALWGTSLGAVAVLLVVWDWPPRLRRSPGAPRSRGRCPRTPKRAADSRWR